jgi:hypothetical protein
VVDAFQTELVLPPVSRALCFPELEISREQPERLLTKRMGARRNAGYRKTLDPKAMES